MISYWFGLDYSRLGLLGKGGIRRVVGNLDVKDLEVKDRSKISIACSSF